MSVQTQAQIAIDREFLRLSVQTDTSGQTIIAREYLRVSQDRSGRQRSVEETHDDNQRAATAQGFTLGEPYREQHAVSASRYSTKTRDAFRQLLADLEADRFGAQVLILWESSRGSRRAAASA